MKDSPSEGKQMMEESHKNLEQREVHVFSDLYTTRKTTAQKKDVYTTSRVTHAFARQDLLCLAIFVLVYLFN